jgi:hypothetical protein
MRNDIDLIAEKTYTTKSNFIRQSILRNLEITKMEMALLKSHYKENDLRLLRVIESPSHTR